MDSEAIIQIIFLVAFGMLTLFIAVLLFMVRSRKKVVDEKLKRKEQEVRHKKEMLVHAIETQEKERDRFSAEIHDDIASKLNVMHIQLSSIEDDVNPEVADKIALLKGVLKSGIEDTRRIAYDLFPVILEKFGLHTAIEELVELSTTRSLTATFKSNIDDDTFPRNTAVHIYRILQELMNNSIKYANGSTISIELMKEGSDCVLTFTDNGTGSVEKLHRDGGMGMLNINSRLNVLDAEMQVENANPGLQFLIHFKHGTP